MSPPARITFFTGTYFCPYVTVNTYSRVYLKLDYIPEERGE